MSIPIFNCRKAKQRKRKGNTITLFANQKGGVGKSTTCVMYADYLTRVKGIKLVLIDADPQHSVLNKYKKDLEENPNIKPSYYVDPFDDLDDEKATEELLEDMRKQDYDFIIDSPGNMSMQGLMKLILGVDVIVIPFVYEKTCVFSTDAFINLNCDLAADAGREKPTPMLFLPNMYNMRWGNSQERAYDRATKENYEKIGKVCPKIPSSVIIRRYSSLYLSDEQKDLVGPCYEFMWNRIYNEIMGEQ